MIQIKGLCKQFNKNTVLSNLDLSIEEKGIFAILGPNGSGKTTLIKSILGMVIPDKGEIKVAGKNIKRTSDYRNQIDYLPQIANFPTNLKVRELFRMIKDLRGSVNREAKLIKLFGLEPFLDKKLGNLSGGTKQKVNIVLGFMFDSKILILDEPTTGLHFEDIRVLMDVLNKLADKGNTVLIIEHNLDVIKIADWIIDLGPEGGNGGGEIVAEGTPEHVAATKGSYTGHYLAPLLGMKPLKI